MARITLGDTQFQGTDNFPEAMVEGLNASLTSKNLQLSQSGTNIAITQGTTPVGTFDLQSGGREVWAALGDVLFSGASVSDIHVDDRVSYQEGYSLGIDWRDMSPTTTINENRYADVNLSVAVSNAAFTVTGFGSHLTKAIALGISRNDSSTGDGALMELGANNGFLRVNTSNNIQINTTVGSGSDTWVSLQGELGTVTIGETNSLIFEIVPVPGSTTDYRVVPVLYDGTSYNELDDVTITPDASITGDNLGFSRSTNQRGQITRFAAINSSGYLSHETLDTYLRQHLEDMWVFGLARLISGSDTKEVSLNTPVLLPEGSEYDGFPMARVERVAVYGGVINENGRIPVPAPVSSVTLPENWLEYSFICIEATVPINQTSSQVRARFSSLDPFRRVDIGTSGMFIRLSGDRLMLFNPNTRVLSMSDANDAVITRVCLYRYE